MQLRAIQKDLIVNIVCYLYILLFVYAAVSKLLDFENFMVQLGQSPLLSAIAEPVAYAVPITELAIVLLLLFRASHIYGLWGAYCLMVLFTAYIIVILNFSPFVPCTCGGILENMGWTAHLHFNIGFAVAAALGVFLAGGYSNSYLFLDAKRIAGTLGMSAFTVIASITILFYMSVSDSGKGDFIRNFPPGIAYPIYEGTLDFNSYYLAGFANGTIYFGNTTAPLTILTLDTTLQKARRHRITLSEPSLPFKSIYVTVRPPYFVVSDGTVPCIYSGGVSDWKARLWKNKSYFTAIEPIDSSTAAIRAVSGKTKESVLGILHSEGKGARLSDQLLQKQVDGVFDTDGILLYNNFEKKLLYPYYYRNEFIIADTTLQLLGRRKMIDTNTIAKIKLTYVSSQQQNLLSAPPLIVNKNAATAGRYLYINAGTMGRNERREMWKTASVVDIYDIDNGNYLSSCYIHNKAGKKMTQFRVEGTTLIAFFGQDVVVYKLNTAIKSY